MSTHVKLPFALPRSGYCGAESFRLLESPYKAHEAFLDADIGRRGRLLAEAVGGIQSAHGKGWRLSPARCIKWLALFQAGFEAEKISDGIYGNWRYRVSGGPLVALNEAIRTSDAINSLP